MFYNNNFQLGILGGGQLGRMFIQAAIPYDVSINILDPNPNAPCAKIANNFVVGDFNDYESVINFGKDLDVLTIEIEHVNVEALKFLKNEGVKIYPDPHILEIVQDKGIQKEFYAKNGIATSPFKLLKSKQELLDLGLDYPYIQKMRKGGYDGRGVTVIREEKDLEKAFNAPSLMEEFVDFEKEISVIVHRNDAGESKVFPVVELEFDPVANLVEFLFSPANITKEINDKANELAVKTADAFGLVGILAIEMFVTKNGEVLVNEVAPRTHNSGHHSIEGNVTSQFEQHLRAILNLSLGSTDITRPAVMVNLLGEPNHTGMVKYEGLEEAIAMKDVHIHLYGKQDTKPSRKMGHITILADTLEEAKATANQIKNSVKVISQ